MTLKIKTSDNFWFPKLSIWKKNKFYINSHSSKELFQFQNYISCQWPYHVEDTGSRLITEVINNIEHSYNLDGWPLYNAMNKFTINFLLKITLSLISSSFIHIVSIVFKISNRNFHFKIRTWKHWMQKYSYQNFEPRFSVILYTFC